MEIFNIKLNTNKTILALGAESAGNFCVFNKHKIYFSEDFGDLLEDTNFRKYRYKLNEFLRKNRIKPNIILTDLHPLYKTTALGKKLATKFKAEHIQVQHHLAHIFSAIGNKILQDTRYKIRDTIFGIAMDGTGYGTDGKIWGGEIFELRITNYELRIKRAGHLENQIMIGGDLAVKEPARMLLSILAKIKCDKEFIFKYLKKYYTRNQFELLYNQLQGNFNCQETSSTGRILDAVSVLLGFAGNKRKYKHEPLDLLEQNSSLPYKDMRPKIKKVASYELRVTSYELLTTPLFEYLLKNLHKDKKRLAATAQFYIAEGLHEIISKKQETRNKKQEFFIAGGISNNKIISSYLEPKGFYANKKIPQGDAGISFGQIIYFLLDTS